MLATVISAHEDAAKPSAGAAASARDEVGPRARRAAAAAAPARAPAAARAPRAPATWPPSSAISASTATSAAPASASGRVCMVRAAMTRFGVGLASVLMCAVLAVPVDAQAAGNGLYSPFPTVAARKRAERFVNRLRAPRAQRAGLARRARARFVHRHRAGAGRRGRGERARERRRRRLGDLGLGRAGGARRRLRDPGAAPARRVAVVAPAAAARRARALAAAAIAIAVALVGGGGQAAKERAPRAPPPPDFIGLMSTGLVAESPGELRPDARPGRRTARGADPPDVRLGRDRDEARPLRLRPLRRADARGRARRLRGAAGALQPAGLPLLGPAAPEPARDVPAAPSARPGRVRRRGRAPLRPGRQLLARATRRCPPTRSAPGRSGTSRACRSTGRPGRARRPTRGCSPRRRRRSARSTRARRSSSAGLPQTRIGVPFARYAEGLYRAGAQGSFDVLAIHPYARDAAGVLDAVAQARALIMDRHGDHSPIWVTEVGWASAGPAERLHGRARAARRSACAPPCSRSPPTARRLGLRAVVYFGLRDSARLRRRARLLGPAHRARRAFRAARSRRSRRSRMLRAVCWAARLAQPMKRLAVLDPRASPALALQRRAPPRPTTSPASSPTTSYSGSTAYRDKSFATQQAARHRARSARRSTGRRRDRARTTTTSPASTTSWSTAASHNIRVLPILFDPPPFRSSRPRRHAKHGTSFPKVLGDMARLRRGRGARATASGGDFWTSHPALPDLPFTAYQIWNEPNLAVYSPPKPSARRTSRC